MRIELDTRHRDTRPTTPAGRFCRTCSNSWSSNPCVRSCRKSGTRGDEIWQRFWAAIWRRYLLDRFQCLLAGLLHLGSLRAGVQKSLGFNSCAIPYLVVPVRRWKLSPKAWHIGPNGMFFDVNKSIDISAHIPLNSDDPFRCSLLQLYSLVHLQRPPATSLPIGTILKESLELKLS